MRTTSVEPPLQATRRQRTRRIRRASSAPSRRAAGSASVAVPTPPSREGSGSTAGSTAGAISGSTAGSTDPLSVGSIAGISAIGQAVADAPDRLDARRGIAELGPEVVDVRIHGVRRHRHAERPGLVEQLVASEGLAGVAKEAFEQ